MKKIDILKISLSELKNNKIRTILTMLGIIFGVGAVIAMMSIGEGARMETLEQIELMGTNNIIIKSKSLSKEKLQMSFSPGLTLKDSDSIKRVVKSVKSVTPQRVASLNITYKSKMTKTKIIGTNADYPNTYNSTLQSGNFFSKYHMENYHNVCVIGPGIKEELFKFEDPLGREIKIDDVWFKIIGVTSSKHTGNIQDPKIGIRNFNRDIYIPFSTMINKMHIPAGNNGDDFFFGGDFSFSYSSRDSENIVDRNKVQQLTIKIKDDHSIKQSAKIISRILKRTHFNSEDYEIIIPEQLLEQKQKTQRIFNIVMGAIAGISLLVGGIGIMNIMLANVLERRREIGIRRAIGATASDVLNQFLYEAMIISLMGGIIGILIGYILTSLITAYAEWRTAITSISVIVAFCVSVLVGMIFGYIPAKKAAREDPIEAIRYE